MKLNKKILSAIFAGLLTLNVFGNVDDVQAASRDEIAAIKKRWRIGESDSRIICKAGDIADAQNSEGLIATDIMNNLPLAVKKLRGLQKN